MQAITVVILCVAVVAAYVIYYTRKDRRIEREYRAMSAAMSPGPRIRKMTASGSQRTLMPVVADDFSHVPTDYGTLMPTEVDTAFLGRADTELHHHSTSVYAETSSHDTCSVYDSSYDGGFDGSD